MFYSDYPLAALTTFGVPAKASFLTEIHSDTDLAELYQTREFKSAHQKLVLGGGSNLLFTRDFDGLVIQNKLKGFYFEEENEQSVLVQSGSGENWHELVTLCVAKDLGGIENLSLIPGTVGASPVQNIGAYGVELKDVFVRLEAFDFVTGKMAAFDKEQCRFGYRDSVFKQEFKNRFFITNVTFRLKKPGYHSLHMQYGNLQHTLQEMEINQPGIADISRAVIHIRSTKLPDPKVVGNAGSFFKNPEIAQVKCELLLADNPLMPVFDVPRKGFKKVAAGWLIEQCGWKGKSLGNAAVHRNQALVLTNPGNATGTEIKALAEAIQRDVLLKFDIQLETEVNIY